MNLFLLTQIFSLSGTANSGAGWLGEFSAQREGTREGGWRTEIFDLADVFVLFVFLHVLHAGFSRAGSFV